MAPVASSPVPTTTCSADACASPNVFPPSVLISSVAVPTAPGVATRITTSAFFAATPETRGVTLPPVTIASVM